eukprot:gene7384-11706_t
MFSERKWLKENAGKQDMIFGDNVRFLNLEWKVVTTEKNQLFLFGKKNGKDYRIRLYCERVVICNSVKYVSGEMRTNTGKMKQITDEKSKKKNLLSWSTDEVYHWAVNVLNIDNNEAQILKEEGVDGFVLSNLNDQEMKGLNVKFGNKIKVWEGIKNIQK